MYLTNADAIGDPIHHLTTNDPPFTNPYTQGVVLRTQWGRVEPHEHSNADDFYWDYLDQAVALAAAHGKKVSIQIVAGVTTPQWVYDAGAPAFYVTTEYGYSSITDGVTTAGSTTVTSAGNTAGWDSDSVGLRISGGSIPAGATIVAVNSSNNVTISALDSIRYARCNHHRTDFADAPAVGPDISAEMGRVRSGICCALRKRS